MYDAANLKCKVAAPIMRHETFQLTNRRCNCATVPIYYIVLIIRVHEAAFYHIHLYASEAIIYITVKREGLF